MVNSFLVRKRHATKVESVVTRTWLFAVLRVSSVTRLPSFNSQMRKHHVWRSRSAPTSSTALQLTSNFKFYSWCKKIMLKRARHDEPASNQQDIEKPKVFIIVILWRKYPIVLSAKDMPWDIFGERLVAITIRFPPQGLLLFFWGVSLNLFCRRCKNLGTWGILRCDNHAENSISWMYSHWKVTVRIVSFHLFLAHLYWTLLIVLFLFNIFFFIVFIFG